MGMLTEVVEDGRHLERALEIAEGLAGFPQDTMLADRRAAIEGFGLPLDAGLAVEALAGPTVFGDRADRRGAVRRRRGPRRRRRRRLTGACTSAPLRADRIGVPQGFQERERMTYFVTGATGFIGRHLVEELLAKRDGDIHVLVREGSRARLDELCAERWGRSTRIKPVVGDLASDRLGVEDDWIAEHRGERRPLLPPRGDLRHDRLRRGQRAAQHRRHPQRGRAGQRAGGRLPAPHLLDRRRGALQGRLPRGHVRRGPEAARRPTTARSSSPSSIARDESDRARGGSTGRRSSSATRRPARWTRSTGPTTSSRRSSSCATGCPSGCR